jgi:hypothetical protein
MFGSFLPSLGRQPKSTRVEGADMVMQSSAFWPNSIRPVSAFYKGESQGKNFPGDWKEQRLLPDSPAHVMLGGSWGSPFSQIHVAA